MKIKAVDGAPFSPFLLGLSDHAWFTGFTLAFVDYLALRKIAPTAEPG